MLFSHTVRSASARHFAGSKSAPIVANQNNPLSSKKSDIDERALKKVGDIVTTLSRYETHAEVPERIQWSQKARHLLEMPLALLKAGAFFVPTPTPLPDNRACSHTDSPLNRKIPRP